MSSHNKFIQVHHIKYSAGIYRCKLTQKLTVLFIPIMAAIKDMQLLVMTIIAANCRPVRDRLCYRLCYIMTLLHFLRDEPGPQIFHPLRALHLSCAYQVSSLPCPLQGQGLHFQLTVPKRCSDSPTPRIKENGWPHAICASE